MPPTLLRTVTEPSVQAPTVAPRWSLVLLETADMFLLELEQSPAHIL